MPVMDEHVLLHDSRMEVLSFEMLKEKTVLVTGASRGIGRAAAVAMAEAGANVAVNFQSTFPAAKETCAAVRNLGVRARLYQANVAHEDEARAMVAEVIDDFGRIDVLVNNAGITRDKSFLKMTQPMWDEVLQVNLHGAVHVAQAVLPGMIEAGWGRIINVSSIVGQTGNFGQANYAAAKGALIALTKSLAREVARKGVTVNAVAPGFIETDMTKDMLPAALDAVKGMTPAGRLGRPEEVAAAILFLACPAASYITGQVLAVNGGMYM
jgi:3-oxoacyl-[acyl-carrier protein] reductase